jgi:Zn finger protein HypA/HybF involved in hydrogenase expression
MEEIYEIEILCSNCNFKNKIEVLKGKTVAETLCPNCGCKTLEIPNGSEEAVSHVATEHTDFWGQE